MPIKPIRLAMLCVLAMLSYFSHAQSVIIGSNVNLPPDSITRNQLLRSLNGFLAQKEKTNKDNSYVLKEYLPETSDLLDEIKRMEQNNVLKVPDFYKCYLTNAAKTGENDYVVQIAYIGIKDNAPVLRAAFRLQAKREGVQFYFNSPLKQNTISWRMKKFGNLTCYFKDTLNAADVKAYQKQLAFYDKKLNAPDWPIAYYYCDNFTEVQQILGIDYKLDYNGTIYNSLTAHENNMNLTLNASISYPHRFDAHDLFHERLALVMKSNVNRPVNEGCAYLYGGSWGYTWDEVLAKFKSYAAANPNADWLKLYTESNAFESGKKPLYVAYVLNALIVQKIEREKGFAPVMELLGCGLRQKGDENYFKALEKITDIIKADFNVKMWELIKGS